MEEEEEGEIFSELHDSITTSSYARFHCDSDSSLVFLEMERGITANRVEACAIFF